MSEIFLVSAISNDDVNTKINRYSLQRADYPNDSLRVGVCIYFKE